MTPGPGGLLPGCGRICISHLVKMRYFFKSLLLYDGVGSDKNKKTVFMMCTLIPILFTGDIILQLSSAIVDFLKIYDGAVDM